MIGTSKYKDWEDLHLQHAPLFRNQNNVIACGDGWFDLISHLCDCIQGYYESNYIHDTTLSQPIIIDVKQKYGTLRVDIDNSNDIIDGMIWFAEELSEHTCELTGKPGKVRDNKGWHMTLCDEKAQEFGCLE